MDSETKDVFKTALLWIWYVMMPIGASIYFFDEPLFNAFGHNPVFIWVALAAIFNAVMDCIENEHIEITIFKRLLPRSFWYKRDSWDKAFRLFGYKFDAWHLTKSAMIMCYVMAMINYSNMFGPIYDFIMIGCWYNLVFNGFYNRIFSKKVK